MRCPLEVGRHTVGATSCSGTRRKPPNVAARSHCLPVGLWVKGHQALALSWEDCLSAWHPAQQEGSWLGIFPSSE